MVRFEHSQSLNSTFPVVWQVISDIASWPTIFPEIQRVLIGQRANDEVTVNATDSRSRSFQIAVTQSADEEPGRRSVTLSFDKSAPHPLGYRSLVWSLTAQGDQTLLSLTADYEQPRSFLNGLIAKLRGRADVVGTLHATFDAFARLSQQQALKYHETVQTILSRKGKDVISVSPSNPVSSVCALINEHRIGAVLVLDDKNHLIGLVSERDVVYHLARTGTAILDQSVDRIMTRDLIVCEPESDLLFIMACMTDNKVRHLPVIENDKLCGVISIGDVVQERIHALEAESDRLRNYIAAREWRFHGQRGVDVVSPLVEVTTS